MDTAQVQAIIYTRLSDASKDNSLGSLGDQEKRCRKLADGLGWNVVRVIRENEISGSHASAWKRRTVIVNGRKELRVRRAGWTAMLEAISDGEANGLIVLDMDRATRNMRDLEDVLELVESGQLHVAATTGSFDLSSSGGRFAARVLVAHAQQSSEDTSRRVIAARERDAAEGKHLPGGRRPYVRLRR